jgi:hypothetical protein
VPSTSGRRSSLGPNRRTVNRIDDLPSASPHTERLARLPEAQTEVDRIDDLPAASAPTARSPTARTRVLRFTFLSDSPRSIPLAPCPACDLPSGRWQRACPRSPRWASRSERSRTATRGSHPPCSAPSFRGRLRAFDRCFAAFSRGRWSSVRWSRESSSYRGSAGTLHLHRKPRTRRSRASQWRLRTPSRCRGRPAPSRVGPGNSIKVRWCERRRSEERDR